MYKTSEPLLNLDGERVARFLERFCFRITPQEQEVDVKREWEGRWDMDED